MDMGLAPGDAAGLQRIDHIGIAVPDLDEAIGFYQSVLGMTCEHREDNTREGVREAMMVVGTDPAGPRIQLLAPLSAASTIGRFLERSGPGLQQVAYTVDDLDRTSAALRERGLRLLYQTAQTGTAGSRVNFVHPKDAGGVLIELVEPAASGSRSSARITAGRA
jgi:methylmalonyl-CoA/ethylmalonyl-CoA epimerase